MLLLVVDQDKKAGTVVVERIHAHRFSRPSNRDEDRHHRWQPIGTAPNVLQANSVGPGFWQKIGVRSTAVRMTRPTLFPRRSKTPYRDCFLGLSGARGVARHLRRARGVRLGCRSTRKYRKDVVRPACYPPRVDPDVNRELVQVRHPYFISCCEANAPRRITTQGP